MKARIVGEARPPDAIPRHVSTRITNDGARTDGRRNTSNGVEAATGTHHPRSLRDRHWPNAGLQHVLVLPPGWRCFAISGGSPSARLFIGNLKVHRHWQNCRHDFQVIIHRPIECAGQRISSRSHALRGIASEDALRPANSHQNHRFSTGLRHSTRSVPTCVSRAPQGTQRARCPSADGHLECRKSLLFMRFPEQVPVRAQRVVELHAEWILPRAWEQHAAGTGLSDGYCNSHRDVPEATATSLVRIRRSHA